MTDMEIRSPDTSRLGVFEIIGGVAAAFTLSGVFGKLIARYSEANLSDKKAAARKNTVTLLKYQLDSIIQEHKLQPGTAAPAGVEDLLQQLVQTAEELLKSVSSGTFERVKGALVHGSFKTRVQKLRTGITDIGNALRSQASSSSFSPYQAGSAPSTQHHQAPALASASGPAPAQNSMQMNFNQPCAFHFHMGTAQAPGVTQGQVAGQSAPLAYPPQGYPSKPYPPFGLPPYSYPPPSWH